MNFFKRLISDKNNRKDNDYNMSDESISQEEFALIVSMVGKGIPRLISLNAESFSVYGTVESMTGLSTWSFRIDFYSIDDYKIYNEVKESHIPELIANRINEALNKIDELETINYTSSKSKELGKYKDPFEDPEFIAKMNQLRAEADVRRAEAEKNKAEAQRKAAEADCIRAENERIESERKHLKRKRNFKIIGCLILILLIVFSAYFVYSEYKARIKVGFDLDELIGLEYSDVINKLENAGFTHVVPNNISDLPVSREDESNIVTNVKIGDDVSFKKDDKYRYDVEIRVTFHTIKMLTPPINNDEAKGENYKDIKKKFAEEGFTNIKTVAEYDVYLSVFSNAGDVKCITIEGEEEYGSSYRPDAKVVITYHDLHKNKPE